MARIGKWKTDKGRTGFFIAGTAALAVLLALGAVIAAAVRAFPSGESEIRAYPIGTKVNGVDIGGMTKSDARHALGKETDRILGEYSVEIRGKEGAKLVLSSRDLGAATDMTEVLEKAFEGGEYELSCVFSRNALIKSLEERGEELGRAPGKDRLAFDSSFRPEGERFFIEAGEQGEMLDAEACAALIESGEREFDAVLLPVPAEACEWKELPVLLGEYETRFSSGGLNSPNRVYNIKKAAEMVNGSVIEPYSVLSMNEILGPRTRARGWKEAPGITELGAGTEDQAGGGVCQVSSTVFNAGLLSDMAVISRRAHSRMVAYAEGGRDATIATDSIDLIMKNRSEAELFVFVWADGENGLCRCEIYGRPLSEEIRIEAVLAETIKPTEDEYELDTSLPEGAVVEENPAITGYRYLTYRIYSKEGEELRRELVAESNYYMHPRKLRAGRKAYAEAMGQTVSAPPTTPQPVQETPAPTPLSPSPAPFDTPPPSPSDTPPPAPSDTPPPAPSDTPPPSPEPSDGGTGEPNPSPSPEPSDGGTGEPNPSPSPAPPPGGE